MLSLKTAVALVAAMAFGLSLGSCRKKAKGFIATENVTGAVFAVHVSYQQRPGRPLKKHIVYFRPKTKKEIRQDASAGWGSCSGGGPEGEVDENILPISEDEGVRIIIHDQWGSDSKTPIGEFKHEMLLKWTDAKIHETENGAPVDAEFEWLKKK